MGSKRFPLPQLKFLFPLVIPVGYEVLWMSCGGSCGYPKPGFLVAIGREFAQPHVSTVAPWLPATGTLCW